MSTKKYRNYFQINESYFPAVNEDVIKTQVDVWKSYYPHETFIKLLNQTKSVLTGKQKMSIWVEGPYGTGKSHAVLTLKKLLDCSNEELKEYFSKYKSVFKTDDFYNEFYNIKNQEKKILTVHRYGSSDVKSDNVLMNYVQESIILALKEQNYQYFGQVGIKQAIIEWLSDDNNRTYFNNIIQQDEYKLKFGGVDADTVLEQLKSFSSEKAIQELIEKISSVGEDKGIKPFVLRKEDLKEWILDVIDKNKIKAIFFIWDEFSDYFYLNKENLSGFQYLVEISETNPFYFAIVTHKSEIFFENSKDGIGTKINGRFIAPHCSIELPDNIAFILTAHAMQKVEDKAIQKEWDETVDSLYDLTHDSRNEVKTAAQIGDKELKGVLPIHPYASMVLKHIASAYDSNQRSMFDFIKNDRGEEIKGFQWFIDNYGPEDDETLLTVDMLWDFFYEKGKDQLAPQIRTILDVYNRTESHNLMEKQKRVLKTILILQALNERVGDSVLLFVPNDKNLGLAFEGTDITPSNAASLASSLVKDQIIFERPMGGGLFKYSALTSSGNLEEITKEKERLTKEVRTDKLIEEGEFINEFKLPTYLSIRYPALRLLTYENIKNEIIRLKADSDTHPTRLYAAYTFARNDEESTKIRNEIQKTFADGFEKIVFIDYSGTHLNQDLFNQYIDNMANSNYQKGKDANQSKTYDRNAKEALRRWRIQIQHSSPKVYSINNLNGLLCNSESSVFDTLKAFDKQNFDCAVETYVNVLDTMYAANSLKLGAECGITGELKGTFKSSNENTKLEKQFEGVWGVDNYWNTKPNELLSKVKKAVNGVIKNKLDTDTRVAISDIYSILTDEPFAFMPCNLTAFILGFVLREYANDEYNWTDDVTTTPMTVDKLKEMIEEIIKQQQTPNPKYRDKYIVAMSPEQKEFNKSTAKVFGIDEALCSSIENTRSRMRLGMVSYKFPIWTLKYLNLNTVNDKETINKLIDLYVELANNTNTSRSETDVALEIGKLYLDNKNLDTDMQNIISRDNCIQGMGKYLETYKEGILLKLAKSINDPGSYIDEISSKFSEASNWVWNKQTVDEMIDATITEYCIVLRSNDYIVKTSSYVACLNEWAKKCENFKTSYNSIKFEIGELDDLLGILYQIKKNGKIYDEDKNKFLLCLETKNKEFKDFCENQIALLRKVGSFYFDELSDEDINNIAKNIFDVFDKENSEFQSSLETLVGNYKANMSKYKLSALWKEKTGTNSPIDWSNKYKMPILCMVPTNEQENARRAFDVANSTNSEKKIIDEAIDYINKAKYIEKFSDEKYREDSFKNIILKNYSILIDDTNDIKSLLIKNYPTLSPYHWLGSIAVNESIEKYAHEKYKTSGAEKVSKIIDSMDSDNVKKYLKDMIKDNMVVGIEILNSKK